MTPTATALRAYTPIPETSPVVHSDASESHPSTRFTVVWCVSSEPHASLAIARPGAPMALLVERGRSTVQVIGGEGAGLAAMPEEVLGGLPLHGERLTAILHCGDRIESVRVQDRTAVVRRALHDDPGRRWTLQDMATLAGLSSFHFLRVFKHALGVTPHHFLRHVRCRHALVGMLTGERLSTCAYRAGFADQSHLTRMFVTFLGVPPGQLREAVAATFRRAVPRLTCSTDDIRVQEGRIECRRDKQANSMFHMRTHD